MAFPAALIWLVLAVGLLLLVLVGLDSDGLLLVGGLAALLLTLLTGLLPLPPLLQVGVFALLGGAGYLLLRRLSAGQDDRQIPPGASADEAEVIAGFDAVGRGRVRWQGQSWAAINLEPTRTLPIGAQVTVMGREGTRLRVLPR